MVCRCPLVYPGYYSCIAQPPKECNPPLRNDHQPITIKSYPNPSPDRIVTWCAFILFIGNHRIIFITAGCQWKQWWLFKRILTVTLDHVPVRKRSFVGGVKKTNTVSDFLHKRLWLRLAVDAFASTSSSCVDTHGFDGCALFCKVVADFSDPSLVYRWCTFQHLTPPHHSTIKPHHIDG